jgi:hypothetical protein
MASFSSGRGRRGASVKGRRYVQQDRRSEPKKVVEDRHCGERAGGKDETKKKPRQGSRQQESEPVETRAVTNDGPPIRVHGMIQQRTPEDVAAEEAVARAIHGPSVRPSGDNVP